MSGSEKKLNKNTCNLSFKKHETKKFLEVSHCSCAKQRQRNVQKKFATPAKFAFWMIRPIVVFHRSLALPLPFARFYILFEQTINIIESFALSPG